jgi:hypothetical protein
MAFAIVLSSAVLIDILYKEILKKILHMYYYTMKTFFNIYYFMKNIYNFF